MRCVIYAVETANKVAEAELSAALGDSSVLGVGLDTFNESLQRFR